MTLSIFKQAAPQSPSPSSTFQLLSVSFQKGKKNHPSYTAPKQPPHRWEEAADLAFTCSLPPHCQAEESRGKEEIRQLRSLCTSKQPTPEECR